MGTLKKSENLTGTINVEQQTGTVVTLNTGNTYIDKNIQLTLNISDANLIASNIKKGVSILGVNGTFTKASTVSSGQTAASSSKILNGYSAWVDGVEVKGNIATKTSSNMTVSGKTVTAPAGYYASDQSKSVAVGTITSGNATISSATYTYNSKNDNFDVTGSATIAAPSVGTAGYVSNTEGTKNTNTATLSTTASKITGSTSITGTTTKQPSIVRQTFTISGVTDASNGAAITTAPTSGVYVKVKSSANTGTLTATPLVSTAGYGTDSNHGISSNTATVGASASADTYVPIKTGSATTPVTTITSAPSINISNTGLITASNSKTQSVTPTVSSGYVISGTAGTITVDGSNTLQLTSKAATTYTPTTTDQEIASGTYLTGKQTIKGDANLIATNIKNGVTIFGITGTHKGYNIVESEDANGGTIVNIITDDNIASTYSWLGLDAEFVQDFPNISWTLNDTSWSTYTPITNATTTIKSYTNLTTFTADPVNHEYAIVWHVKIIPSYQDGATNTAKLNAQYHTFVSYIRRIPNNKADMLTNNDRTLAVYNINAPLKDYYNTSSQQTTTYDGSYGIYATVQSPSINSSTSNTPIITVRTPTIAVRCHDSYFSLANAEKIIAENTIIEMSAKLYRFRRKQTFAYGLYKDLINFYLQENGGE